MKCHALKEQAQGCRRTWEVLGPYRSTPGPGFTWNRDDSGHSHARRPAGMRCRSWSWGIEAGL